MPRSGTTLLQSLLTAQARPRETLRHEALRELAEHLSVDEVPDGRGGTVRTLRFTGVNVQIVNGLGDTNTANGVGNLVVEYNEPRSFGGDDRTGSHNIVAGRRNDFPGCGGLVLGTDNTLRGTFASVSGGRENVAEGLGSSVGGGRSNTATGSFSSVSGGQLNEALGTYASVSPRSSAARRTRPMAGPRRSWAVSGTGRTASPLRSWAA